MEKLLSFECPGTPLKVEKKITFFPHGVPLNLPINGGRNVIFHSLAFILKDNISSALFPNFLRFNYIEKYAEEMYSFYP